MVNGILWVLRAGAPWLYLSRAAIQHILTEYRQAGDYIPTRCSYHDFGPAPSHKVQIIRLYLRGFQPTEIAQQLTLIVLLSVMRWITSSIV